MPRWTSLNKQFQQLEHRFPTTSMHTRKLNAQRFRIKSVYMCVNILCISYKYFYVKTNNNLILSHNTTWNKYINFKLFLSLSLIKGHFIII